MCFGVGVRGWGGAGDWTRGAGFVSRKEEGSTAPPRRRLHGSALDLHVGLFRASGRGPGTHPLLDLCSHGHEGLLDISGVFGAGFQERDAQGVCEFLGEEERAQRH